jgi:carbon storage regulator CsrA
MLVLMRRVGEDVFLTVNQEDGTTQEIRLTVSKISGKQVTLGIEANKNVKILRDELLNKEKI